MKKIILLFSVLFLFGCSLINTPTKVVEDYLNKYINLDDDIITDIDTTIINENLSKSNIEIYKEVLQRQYENIKYEILDESINGNKSYVKVKLTTYDLYKTEKDSENYMNDHIDEFSDVNNLFNNESYMTYRLNQMLNTNEKITNEITFELTKNNNEWIIDNPTNEMLEKIHGMYNYND